MGWLTSKSKRQEQEARASEAANARRRADAEQAERDRRADAWRHARNAAIKPLHAARGAYGQARQTYDRYAPGPQKDAAGAALNAAADQLAQAERAFDAIDDFSSWSRNH
ncbi:hypothetical protein ABT352_33445 [Streptosporangium sp. NPDC000563]|uniref:hypothetical protein n=1 Tax=Streptosporangium sp. NPDC000563 TaxID=3154366 RepID=UPI00331AA534